jgi:hypothetical protein
MKTEFKYLEIRDYETDTVTKRIDVTGLSERRIEKKDDAYNINLNHNLFYTTTQTYSEPQPTI